MRSFWTTGWVLGVLALVAAPCLAQQRPGGRGGRGGGFFMSPIMLLSQKPVQEELKLTEEQVKKVTELSAKQREAFTGFADLSQEERGKKFQELNSQNEKAVAEILKPDQSKRLKEISLQAQGPRAFANPEVANALGITDEQKAKLRSIQEENAQEAQKLRQAGASEEAQQKRAELTKATNDKMLAVLTPEQKTKWKEMTGEPFKGELRFGFGGAARRPGR
jgi:Spy/CpxP family protein refolding chaperone